VYGTLTYMGWNRENGSGPIVLFRADETGDFWELVDSNDAAGYASPRTYLSPEGVLKIVFPGSATYDVDVVVLEGHLWTGA
jgi:hypothetical protein